MVCEIDSELSEARRQHGVDLHSMDYWLGRLPRANKKLRRHSRSP
jgi:hypothetical protein